MNIHSGVHGVNKPSLIILVSIWFFFLGLLLLSLLVALSGWLMPTLVDQVRDGSADNFAVIGLSIGLFGIICGLGLAIAAGIGLLRGLHWGWILGIIGAIISLFSFPIGTVIGVLILIYLLRTDVKDYFARHPVET